MSSSLILLNIEVHVDTLLLNMIQIVDIDKSVNKLEASP